MRVSMRAIVRACREAVKGSAATAGFAPAPLHRSQGAFCRPKSRGKRKDRRGATGSLPGGGPGCGSMALRNSSLGLIVKGSSGTPAWSTLARQASRKVRSSWSVIRVIAGGPSCPTQHPQAKKRVVKRPGAVARDATEDASLATLVRPEHRLQRLAPRAGRGLFPAACQEPQHAAPPILPPQRPADGTAVHDARLLAASPLVRARKARV